MKTFPSRLFCFELFKAMVNDGEKQNARNKKNPIWKENSSLFHRHTINKLYTFSEKKRKRKNRFDWRLQLATWSIGKGSNLHYPKAFTTSRVRFTIWARDKRHNTSRLQTIVAVIVVGTRKKSSHSTCREQRNEQNEPGTVHQCVAQWRKKNKSRRCLEI